MISILDPIEIRGIRGEFVRNNVIREERRRPFYTTLKRFLANARLSLRSRRLGLASSSMPTNRLHPEPD
jgi:hypothetical protein